jgi:hypothetical protein
VIAAAPFTVKTPGPNRCVTTGRALVAKGVNSSSTEYEPAGKDAGIFNIDHVVFGLHLLK